MELKVNSVAIPEAITFNYEELKAELLQKVAVYEAMVYGEDQIKEAKADRAKLNHLKKALNDERIRREKEYMEPFNRFRAQVAEIISIIDRPVEVIDRQIKAAEERQKAEKFMKIQDFFFSLPQIEGFPELLLSQIFEDKWLNASVSMKTIQEAIGSRMGQIANDLAVCRQLPAYAFEAEQVYKQTLDLAKAVSEAHRLQERAEKKAAWEAAQVKPKAEPAPTVGQVIESIERQAFHRAAQEEPARQWIGFQALLSVEEAKALGNYLKANGIKYKAI